MWLLDRLEAWDKENYNKVFNRFKTVVCKKHKGNLTNKQIRERLENVLKIKFDFEHYHKFRDDDLTLFVMIWIDLYESRIILKMEQRNEP